MKRKIKILAIFLIACICLTGCGSNANDITKEIEKGSENTSDGDKLNLKSDDTKYIVTSGTTTQVFYHDGKNITGFALYFDYGDTKTAQEMYTLYKDSYADQEEVKNVTYNKNYFIVEYNDSYVKKQFSDSTIDDVKKLYDSINK